MEEFQEKTDRSSQIRLNKLFNEKNHLRFGLKIHLFSF